MNVLIAVATLLLFLILLILISGLEYAYLASNKLAIALKRNQGTRAGRLIGQFFDKPESFWSGMVISFYIILVAFCFLFCNLMTWVYFYSGSRLLMESFYLQMVLDFLLVSFIILIAIGLLAKRSFEFYPEKKLNTWSFFIGFINQVTKPLSGFFIALSEFILKYLFNVDINKKETIFARINTQQFLRHAIQGHEDFDDSNKELFDKALVLTKMKIRKCMTPRNETIALDINSPIESLKKLFVDTKLSKIVIYEVDLDNVLGYVHHVDIFRKPQSIKSVLLPIITTPATMNAVDLLQMFTKEHRSIARVVDEFGGTAGFVTMEDILEEIFGDINDEYDSDRFMEKQISKNEFVFSGRMELDYLNEKYDFNFPSNEAQTLSGHIIDSYESIPKQKERIIIDHFEFTVLRVADTRIETVKVKLLPN